MPGDMKLLEVKDLAAGYNGTPALRDVTFAAERGTRIGVLGPNGGGKTTLFRVLLQELASGLLALCAAAHIGAERLRAAGEAAIRLAELTGGLGGAEQAANAAAEEVLWLRLLLSIP